MVEINKFLYSFVIIGLEIIALIMTKTTKENLLVVLISNAITIILVVMAPKIYGLATNQTMESENNPMFFSLPMVVFYIYCALIICISFTLLKTETVRDIVINNSITPIQTETISWRKADEIREIYRNKRDDHETAVLDAVKEYTYTVLSPYMTDENLEILCQNIRLYGVPKSSITPVNTDGKLNTIDIKHYGWNIGERVGWNGQRRAMFVKLCFPIELQELEEESIRRTLRQKGKCMINIDIPEKNNYQFHYSE